MDELVGRPTGHISLQFLRTCLETGADVNTTDTDGNSALHIAVQKILCPEPEDVYEPGETARAAEAVAMLLKAGADATTVKFIPFGVPHLVTLKLLHAGARISYDLLIHTVPEGDYQFNKAVFLHRVHAAGGFHVYKEERYGRMMAVRLLARDRNVPKEVASICSNSWPTTLSAA